MQHPLAIPVGATAQRPSWALLPRAVRSGIEDALGSTVVQSASQGSGFTQGFASRLFLADGTRVFAKAVNRSLDWLHDAYAREAEVVSILPAGVPAPRLRHRLHITFDAEAWLVLIFDDVDGRPPRRPWDYPEAEAALSAVTSMSSALTPVPNGATWTGLNEEFFALADGWFTDPVHTIALGAVAGPVRELVDLSRTSLLGSTLVHSDLRDDNVIIANDGGVWICDWNWPTVGPIWADAACIAIAMVGDGLDPDRVIGASRWLSEADPDAVDSLLAILLVYFLDASAQPTIETSPHIRVHQAWYARVVEGWLRSRRRW